MSNPFLGNYSPPNVVESPADHHNTNTSSLPLSRTPPVFLPFPPSEASLSTHGMKASETTDVAGVPQSGSYIKHTATTPGTTFAPVARAESVPNPFLTEAPTDLGRRGATLPAASSSRTPSPFGSIPSPLGTDARHGSSGPSFRGRAFGVVDTKSMNPQASYRYHLDRISKDQLDMDARLAEELQMKEEQEHRERERAEKADREAAERVAREEHEAEMRAREEAARFQVRR
ncbi:hypothetical protein HDU93_001074 [Gonapodya sp. JEL0774]|nr:hypothetical protein HDU93_001074 [Gonapodya sp. JEL0774]